MFLYTSFAVKGYFWSFLISNNCVYLFFLRIFVPFYQELLRLPFSTSVSPFPFCDYNIAHFYDNFNTQCCTKYSKNDYTKHRNIV